MAEHITVVLITYGHTPDRTEYAIRTVRAVEKHLKYPNWSWYMADDGSPASHVSSVLAEINQSGHEMIDWHTDHISYGAGANKGLNAAFQKGDLVLMLEDDWELTRDLDLWKYAALLMERPDIGMVRMGYINTGVEATSLGHSGTIYWALNDTQSRNYSVFAFAGHPALIHHRLLSAVKGYPERLQPGDTELQMCWRVASTIGPRIVWPAELGERGPWAAIGTVQSYNWDGGSGAEYHHQR